MKRSSRQSGGPKLGSVPSGVGKRRKKRVCAIEANKKMKGEKRDEAVPGIKDCCVQTGVQCCVNAAASCSEASSRYHHITMEEHICQPCCDEFWKSERSLFEPFRKWKNKWAECGRREPTFRIFVAEELCPYWSRCRDCQKWRSVSRDTPVSPSFFETFTCTHAGVHCKDEEQKSVSVVGSKEWFLRLGVPVLLRSSPAVPLLNNEYFSEEVGMSPTDPFGTNWLDREQPYPDLMQPFYVPTESSKALCVRPDVMEYDEICEFPEYATEPRIYLGLRNLIISLWLLNPTEWLTHEKTETYIICRGMLRILCVKEAQRILCFLTIKGIVNLGILPEPCPLKDLSTKKECRVGIIGAGVAGLTAANQLRKFGCDVRILETKRRFGGRLDDDFSLGVAVGKGAQLVTGVVNNPIILMCLQTGVPFRGVSDACPLVDAETGELVEPLIDMRVDFHFNCLLDGMAEWRKTHGAKETSLEDQILKIHHMLLDKSKVKWSKAEERLFQFQLGNLEFSCGASLSSVSALQWDQNEQFAQFGGDHALLNHGGQTLLQALAKDANIIFDSQVTKVNYAGEEIVVSCKNGKKHTFDKLLITVPLFVLQVGNFRFTPELPPWKKTAICRMGAGIIEKVAVKFPRNFWSAKVKGANYFGHIPKKSVSRGLFNMFYDFSQPKDKTFVLMSYVCGEAVDIVNKKSDEEVVKVFIDTLHDLFPNEEIPEPEGHVITHWGRDSAYGMSYSYVQKNASGEDYATIARDVDQRIFFGGEATNQYFPQTITGACLSGIREAAKIAMSID